MPRHELLLIASSGITDSQILEVSAVAKKAFPRLSAIRQNGVDSKRWPQGPNSMFKAAVQWVKQKWNGPWFFMEPDHVALVPGWLDKLEADYAAKGRPFYGAVFDRPYRHLNGSMIMPKNIGQFNPSMLGANEIPFDLIRPEITMQFGHVSSYMQRSLADPSKNLAHTFPDIKSLNIINPNAILFHGCRDGSILARLREQRFGTATPKTVKAKVILDRPKEYKEQLGALLAPELPTTQSWLKRSFQAFKDRKNSVNVAILYICVHTPSEPEVPRDFNACHERFVLTYLKHKPSIPHKVIIVNYNGERTETTDKIFAPLNPDHTYYVGTGFDIGTYQAVGKTLDYDLVLFCGSQIHFHRDGWLERIVEAYKKHGEGMYGPMGSYERMPHLRTCCIAMPPRLMRKYPYYINSRADTYRAESGDWNLSQWVASEGKPVLMVMWDGELEVKDWRTPANIFRRGDQSNCLVWDRHTKVYAEATPAYKLELERSARGIHGVHEWDIICKGKPRKKSVTVVAFTSLAPKSHAEAIRRTALCLPFETKKLLISPIHVPDFDGEQMRLPEPWAKNGKWSLEKMADFTLTGLHKYITTDMALIVHWDGYALNNSRWTDEFLDWDYIGAPWPRHMRFLKYPGPNGRVGNGGFSLRSKKWLETAAKLPKLPNGISEDVYTAHLNLNHFVKAGCKYAPLAIAMRWSFEHPIEEFPAWQLSDSYGFHGLVNSDPKRAHLKLDPNT